MLWVDYENIYEEELLKIAEKEHLARGVFLDPTCIYYLQNGLCVLNHISEEGNEKIVVYFKKNSLMGFLPFLFKYFTTNYQHRKETVEYIIKTRSPCDVLKIKGNSFFDLLDTSPYLYRGLMCALTQNYGNTIELMAEIINQPAPRRVCRIIQEFIEEQGERNILSPYLTYYDIGIFTALHAVTVAKIFNTLFSEGILEKKGRTVVVAKEKVLKDIVFNRVELSYKISGLSSSPK